MGAEFETFKIDPHDIESVLKLFDSVFSLMNNNEKIQKVIMTLLCSAVTCTVRGISNPEERYKMGEEGIKAFYEDALAAYRGGREKADIEDAEWQAKGATKM